MSDGATSPGMWTVRAPASLPGAPEWLSYSSLTDIEACPRRWTLSNAYYPEIWDRRGYPQRPSQASLEGLVVHTALERVTIALAQASCPAVSDPAAVAVIRGLGGFSPLLKAVIAEVASAQLKQPRVAHRRQHLTRRLTARVQQLRERLQRLLMGVKLARGARVESRDHRAEGRSEAGAPPSRGPLSPGSHPELELRWEEEGWRGYADLFSFTLPDAVEIVDFKTGVQKEDHHLQLKIYALLWAKDTALNPDGLAASVLTLMYPSGVVSVAPPVDMDALAAEVAARGRTARESVSVAAPEARPDAETCRHCSVRHLCDAFWAEEPAAQADRDFADVELQVVRAHGALSWDVEVRSCPGLTRGDQALLRRSERSGEAIGLDRAGAVVRLLGVRVVRPEEDGEVAVLSLSANSEVFLLGLED